MITNARPVYVQWAASRQPADDADIILIWTDRGGHERRTMLTAEVALRMADAIHAQFRRLTLQLLEADRFRGSAVWIDGDDLVIEPAASSATTAERVADDEHWPADGDLPAAGGGI
jgi:hypothetical protein